MFFAALCCSSCYVSHSTFFSLLDYLKGVVSQHGPGTFNSDASHSCGVNELEDMLLGIYMRRLYTGEYNTPASVPNGP